MEVPYRVYIIRNPTGRLYIGLSDDIGRRLTQHNSGVSKWTRHRGPWELVWQSAPLTPDFMDDGYADW